MSEYTQIFGNPSFNRCEYQYDPNSGLMTRRNWYYNNAVGVRGEYVYEPYRSALDRVENRYLPDSTNTLLSKYDYATDALLRRVELKRSGTAFGDPNVVSTETFGYNARNELISATRSSDPNLARGYAYDPIGNRFWATEGSGPTTIDYSTNELNQYTQAQIGTPRAGYAYDADGNLIEQFVAGDANCDGDVDYDGIDFFVAALGGEQAWRDLFEDYELPAPTCSYWTNDVNGDGVVSFDDYDPFVGVLGTSGLWVQYAWDAENRLVAVTPMKPDGAARRVTCAYDYQGRRVEKRVYDWDPNAAAWALARERRFIWDGWLMLREIDQDGEPVQTCLWGLDLAGQTGSEPRPAGSGAGEAVGFLTAAGAIGGLIAVRIDQPEPGTPGGVFVYCYDGNGNVTQLVRPGSGVLGATYDYDPYGARVNAADPNEAVQPWRFSTKQLDAETGLQYYGYRYRDRERWISRDPATELGASLVSRDDEYPGSLLGGASDNTYGYVRSDPLNRLDALGLKARWVVNVTEESEKRINVSLTVNIPCCQCDSIKWIQLYSEKTDLWGQIGVSTSRGVDKGEKKKDIEDYVKRNIPWYPHQAQWDLLEDGACRRLNTLTDVPGAGWRYTYVWQEFEACAVCFKGGGAGYGCVLGCINYGHEY